MRRELSTILTLLILLISPLTFSMEYLPDFTPEWTVTSVCSEKKTVAPVVGMTRCERVPTPRPEKEEYTLAPVITTAVKWAKTALFGRAPPA